MSSPHFSSDDQAAKLVPPISQNDSDEEEIVSESTDARHQKRVALMQAVFAYGFNENQAEIDPEIADQVAEIMAEVPEIDAQLQAAAPERPLAEINKIDLATLRVIMFESRHKKTPKKVLLNEAVEIAKTFGTDSSPKFVNAVLGTILLPDEETEG